MFSCVSYAGNLREGIYPPLTPGPCHTLLPTAMVCPLGLQQMLMFSPLVFTVWAALPTTGTGETCEDHMTPQEFHESLKYYSYDRYFFLVPDC